MKNLFLLGVVFWFVCCVPTDAMPVAPIQQGPVSDPVVYLTASQAHIFQGALQALAAQAGVAFVAEGVPLHPILPEKQTSPVPETGITLSRAVQAIAAAYDYDAQRQGYVFYLTKRYTDPEDLPGVTLQEWAHTLDDIQTITDAFNPHVKPSPYNTRDSLLGDLITSFTPQQRQAIQEKTPGKGLSVATLDPQQQALVWRLSLFFYVQKPIDAAELPIMDIGEAAKVGSLVNFREGELVELLRLTGSHTEDLAGLRVFGYETPVKSSGRMSFRPLSSPQGRFGYSNNAVMIAHYRPGTTHFRQDPTDPVPVQTALPTTARGATATADPVLPSSTLGTAVAALNASLGHDHPLTVASDVQGKPITVIGADNTSAIEVLQAMASIYGLGVTTKSNGTLLIARKRFTIPGDVTGLPDTIREVFPVPFVRALHIDLSDSQREQYRLLVSQSYVHLGQQATAESATNPNSDSGRQASRAVEARVSNWPQVAADAQAAQKLMNEQYDWTQRLHTYLPALRNAAVRRVRADVEARVKTAPGGQLPVSSVSEGDQQAFALALMANCLEPFSQLLSRDVPEYITDFDQLYLTGGFEKAKNGTGYFSVFLSFSRPDGTDLEQKVGTAINLSNNPL